MLHVYTDEVLYHAAAIIILCFEAEYTKYDIQHNKKSHILACMDK